MRVAARIKAVEEPLDDLHQKSATSKSASGRNLVDKLPIQ